MIVPDKLARSLQIAFFLLVNYVFIPIFYIGFKLQSSRRYWNIYQIFYIWDGLMLLNWIATRQKHKAGCKKINDTFKVDNLFFRIFLYFYHLFLNFWFAQLTPKFERITTIFTLSSKLRLSWTKKHSYNHMQNMWFVDPQHQNCPHYCILFSNTFKIDIIPKLKLKLKQSNMIIL